MSRWLSLAVLLVFCLLCGPATAWASEPPAEVTLTLHYAFDAPASTQQDGLVRLSMAGAAPAHRVGDPALPVKTARILLPAGMAVQDVQVSGVLRGSTLLGAPVAPVRAPSPLSAASVAPDDAVFGLPYDHDGPFPAALLGETSLQRWRGHDILYVSLHPLQYWPRAQRLDLYRTLTLTVTLRPDADRSIITAASADVLARLAALVDNPKDARNASPASSSRDVGWSTGLLAGQSPWVHIIITSPTLRDAPPPDNLQALAAHRTAKGLPSGIITTDWIAANYSGARPDGGNDLQTAIRAFIRDAYATWGAEYVLLVGDADAAVVGGETEPPIVPARGLAVTAGSFSDDAIPADLYYACLDGSYDSDGDGLYGESTDGEDGGLPDLLAEVYVGRAAVDSATELANFVRKTIAYELSDHAYLDRALMVGEHLGWPAPWGGDRKDAVLLGSSANGYRTIGFDDSAWASIWRTQTLYDRDEPGNYWVGEQLVGLLNQPIHLLNHMGHSTLSQLMRNSRATFQSQLANAPGLIGYSQGCYAGSFDNRLSSGSVSDDCIVEHLTLGEQGAVAFVANARYGWGDDIEPELGPSQYYDREFWDALLGEGLLALGVAHQDAKEDVFALLGPQGMDRYMRWVAYGLNLFGDPALQVRTPDDGAGARLVAIDDSGAPPTRGNDDGEAQAGETVALTCEVWNGSLLPLAGVTLQAASADSCLTVLSDPLAVGAVAPLSTAPCSGPLVVAVSSACPGTHTAPLSLAVNALRDGQPRLWTSTDGLQIHGAPRIEVTPGEIVAALPLGGVATLPLTIANAGAEELVVDLCAFGEAVSSLSATPTADYTMLLVTPVVDAGLDALRQVLDELNDIVYTVWDPARGAPTAQDLLIYDVVLVGNRHLWEVSGITPRALGDALADYVDLGGKVIDTLLLHANNDRGLAGRYITAGYAPLTVTADYATGDYQVEIVDPDHPLLAWVTGISTHARLNVAAREGAAVPAVYAGTSIPYVAANANVVAINQQLLGATWGEGDLGQLLYNAVLWLCGERGPWVDIAPPFVYIAPGESFDATVTLDSAHAHAPLVFTGTIYVDSSDPVDAHLTIPVEMAVLSDLSTGRLSGVIRSNRTGEPLAGAQVQVQASGSDARLRTTDERGAYSFWLTPATYTLAVSAAGYLPAEAEVTVTPQGRITHDVALVRDAPWLRLDTTTQSGAAPLGCTVAQTFTLHNAGTQPLHVAAQLEDEASGAALPVGWATLYDDSLTIAPGEQAALHIALHTAAFGAPRTARAAVRLTSDDPETPEVVLYAQVEATVPAGYGLVSGAVTCQRSGQPLTAKVIIAQGETVAQSHEAMTDGRYGPWAVPAGDWTVLLDHDGYAPGSQIVTVIAGETTVAPATLLLDAPWLRLTPERVIAVDDGAGPLALDVAVANDGSQPLSYALALDDLPAWVSIVPGDGLVAAGAAEAVSVQIDASAAPPGWTVISAQLTSNDPWQTLAALRLYVRRGQAVLAPVIWRR